jgi:4-hydroxy-2-oxoheptanedioate aldolase
MALALALQQKWAKGETVFGMWAGMPCAFAAELQCVSGVDYVSVDQQHGIIDYADMVHMLRAIEGRGAVPMTRVPVNQAWIIGKALDAGAQGVIVPLVNNREEAEAAVAACRYVPRGIRSFGPSRASIVMNSRDTKVVGDGVLCFVMVETREALRNIDQIAGAPGLDGIYIGPADLALGLGLSPNLDKEEPEHAAAVQAILESCQRHRIVPGIQCGSGRAARKFADRGFRLVTFASDRNLLPAAVEREIAAALGKDAAKEKGYS